MYRIKVCRCAVALCCMSFMSACDSVTTEPSEHNKEVTIRDTSSIFGSNGLSTIGNTIALDAERMVVGDFLNDDIEQLAGALYVYRKEGNAWIKEATLRPFQTEPNLLFGQTADIDGNRILVGSGSPGLEIGWPRRAGPVYLFESNGAHWNESTILTSADVAPECYGLTNQIGVRGNHFFTLANRSDNLETTLCIYAQTDSGLNHTRLDLDELFNGNLVFAKVGINSEGIVVLGPRDRAIAS